MTQRGRKTLGGYGGSGDSSGDPLVGAVIGDRYRIIRHLGDGTMAAVYVGEQLSMGRNVAIKVLKAQLQVDQTAMGRFRQEAEAVSRLHSPHTIQFYDFGTMDDGNLFIAMELLAGETLRQRLKRDGRIPPGEVWAIGSQVCSSLGEAHDAGVIHRDLKPENVYFSVHATPLRPFVKVLDFGLAKLSDPKESQLTAAKQTVGTPAYMPPELAVETRPVDNRSDLYALGVICFEMLTGSRPYHAQTAVKMVMSHIRDPIPSVTQFAPDLPAHVDGFFQRAMAKDATHRPENAAAFASELGYAMQSLC